MASFVRFTEIGRKIVAVGRNYKDHAAELGNKMPEKPLLFLKPTSSYLTKGNIQVPVGCTSLHHEVELGVVMGSACHRVAEQDAASHVAGYALALDMTARDFQEAAKKSGSPWTMAKCFDTACPVSGFVPRAAVADPARLRLTCSVNGQLRQDASTELMHFSIPYLISYISQYITLEAGDLVLTGTPAGVGPVVAGDTVDAALTTPDGYVLASISCGVQARTDAQ